MYISFSALYVTWKYTPLALHSLLRENISLWLYTLHWVKHISILLYILHLVKRCQSCSKIYIAWKCTCFALPSTLGEIYLSCPTLYTAWKYNSLAVHTTLRENIHLLFHTLQCIKTYLFCSTLCVDCKKHNSCSTLWWKYTFLDLHSTMHEGILLLHYTVCCVKIYLSGSTLYIG